jgi:hypothetical protein
MLSLSWLSDDNRNRFWTGSSADVGGRGYLRSEGVRSHLGEQSQLIRYYVCVGWGPTFEVSAKCLSVTAEIHLVVLSLRPDYWYGSADQGSLIVFACRCWVRKASSLGVRE